MEKRADKVIAEAKAKARPGEYLNTLIFVLIPK